MANPPSGYTLQPRADGYYTPKGAGPATWDGTSMSPALTDVSPPAGYSIQQGAYYTDDGQGPYVWDGVSMVLIGESASITANGGVFSGAGTSIIFRGPSRVMGVVLSTSAVGTVRVMDGMLELDATEVLASTATAVGSNVYIPVGTPGVGVAVNAAILLIVTGANIGQVIYIEEA